MSENRKITAAPLRLATLATAVAVGAASLITLAPTDGSLAGTTTGAAYMDQTFGRTDAISVRSAPTFTPGLSRNSRMVETGLGLGNDGNVYQWGRTNGRIGGSIASPGIEQPPTQIPDMPRICQVTGGFQDANALACEDGTIWGWGRYNNRNGTDVTNRDGTPPRQVRIGTDSNGDGPVLDSILAISSTEYAGAGIRADGTIWAWGGHLSYGGNGESVPGASQVDGLPDPGIPGNRPVYLKGAYTNFFVILENGDVYTWGGDSSLPAGTAASDLRAVPVEALRPWMHSTVIANQTGSGNDPYVIAVDGGINMGGAILSDGTVLSWSRAGTPTRIGNRPANATTPANRPALVPGLTDIRSMQFGFTGVVFGTNKGELWGYGAADDISYGSLPQAPILVDTDVVAYASGQGYYIWQKADNTFWARGYNIYGALGLPAVRVQVKREVSYDMSPLIQGAQP